MIGRVVANKLKDTATVLVEREAMHPLYKKTYIQSKKYLVHDMMGTKEGDMVDIVKTRPISKRKHWKIVKIVGKNLVEVVKEKLKKSAEETIAEVMPDEETKESSVVSLQSMKETNKEQKKPRKRKESLKADS
ncbi:30S ribosomal protein S17 [Candidatus Daviesbacteria bacterium RIFCSPLOWO2_01_FULL_38_10]|nr:MAG: 30S ribosomal protein S17 [Candidatus Daviesbacteria bacterium GW2011_GWA2_38_17]OGE27160.1 MAG: 30S ribosomal protein S17 [Candidatus Daviesbacteria bacterium RIFCSPHIGHO2_02_FULL_39_41]OGE29311.1 MAG: 30S ribosomal protein S17 [Candidatus Daviesbacteria bacterium RIFCSPHIGHO2_01_FULL_38_8b]OGE40229.1 MAG: 30S ribosomal protein S17 [Candidatus Daviesbacteria bacterium RIFCSPLOWO2_01_FULL_38_10]OGE45212.1 MAG: 30S ribosomal protein S17 [Candidatus Daviesbacteria bacterium RIFCSPHIGHO2_1